MPYARQPPEVIQSSALDCGPAALSSLLRGLGAPGSYTQLRDLCATDIDGTSIDSIEKVARAAGTDAEQMVVPAEHLLAMPEEYLPAVVVTVLPDGFTHFVVLWRLGRTHALVMDPAVGLRRIPRAQLEADLYRHPAPVPADGWRDWAGSEVFLTALRRRMTAIGLTPPRIDELVTRATDDPSVEGLARLDAAIRAAESGGNHPGDVDPEIGGREANRSCVPVHGDDTTVILHGAVVLRARVWDQASGDPDLLTRLEVSDPGPWRTLAALLPGWGRNAAALVVVALTLAAAGAAEQVGARLILEGGDLRLLLALVSIGGVAATATFAAATAAGRRVERAVRSAWWETASSLPVRSVRTRPASDLADRGHLLHRLRELPIQVVEVVLPSGWCWQRPSP